MTVMFVFLPYLSGV